MIETLFLDNQAYGAADINRAFGVLATGGVVAGIKDGTVNSASALNALGESFASRGITDISKDSLRVVKNDGRYLVNPGNAVFSDGCMVLISGEETVSPAEGVENYVYLLREEARNTSTLICSRTAGSGTFIPLAKIKVDGTIEDTRVYSRTKLIPNTQNFYYSTELTGRYEKNVTQKGDVIGEATIPWGGFNRALALSYDVAYIDFAGGRGYRMNRNGSWEEYQRSLPDFQGADYTYIILRKQGDKLQMVFDGTSSSVSARTMTCKVEVF